MVDLRTFGVIQDSGKYHEEIIYSLALLYNVVSGEISHYLKDHHLTVGKLNILIAVKHQGGEEGIRQVDISKHLIVTPSNMTKMLDKLENDGLVLRYPYEGDRRVRIVKITPEGADLLDTVWEGYNRHLMQAIDVLGKDEQKDLARLLTGWLARV